MSELDFQGSSRISSPSEAGAQCRKNKNVITDRANVKREQAVQDAMYRNMMCPGEVSKSRGVEGNVYLK